MVRAHRRRLGLTQLEAGAVRVPRPATVRLLADAFGLTGVDRDRFFQTAAGQVTARPPAVSVPAQLPAGGSVVPAQLPATVPGFVEAVDAIIEGCARLPLALAIAAAHAAQSGLPLAALAADLLDTGRRLDTLDAGDPASQVRAVLSWPYTILTRPAARLFRLLGLHPGPDISAAAAASLAGCPPAEVRPMLTELNRASLITEHSPGRFTWHDLLRAYATELAAQDPEPERHTALARMLDHYLHTAHATARLLAPARDQVPLASPQPGTTPEEPAEHQQALAWFTAEHAVLLAAVDHAAATGLDTHTWQLGWTVTDFLDLRGHWHDWVAVQQTAVAAAGRLNDPRRPAPTVTSPAPISGWAVSKMPSANCGTPST